MSKSVNRSSREWRRFELCTYDQTVLAELDEVLDRVDITRRDLAVIVTSLRIRPGFSLKDFGDSPVPCDYDGCSEQKGDKENATD